MTDIQIFPDNSAATVGASLDVEVITVPEQGPQGVQGTPGPVGILYGNLVPTTEGTDGNFYIQNVTPMLLYGPKTGGSWPPGVSMVGPQGVRGNAVLSGTAAPTTQGIDGDFYYNSTAQLFYGPKAGGVWPAGVSTAGPQGAQGIQGVVGPIGPSTIAFNYIQNGAMQISQERVGAAVTSNLSYAADRFQIQFSNAGACTAQQVASITPGGSPNRFRYTITTANASVAATDYAAIVHKIEGYRAAPLMFGKATPRQITLQFGVKAPAGTYCVAIRNNANSRTYVGSYTISTANVDTVNTVTLTGDAAGVWQTTSLPGLEIYFCLMAGTNFQMTGNTWTTVGSMLATASQFNLYGTNGNVFELFDVGLYEGASAPGFLVPEFAKEVRECKRYFQKSFDYVVSTGGTPTGNGFLTGIATAGLYVQSVSLEVEMRIAPTVTLFAAISGNGGAVSDSVGPTEVTASATIIGAKAFRVSLSAAGTNSIISYQYVADARM